MFHILVLADGDEEPMKAGALALQLCKMFSVRRRLKRWKWLVAGRGEVDGAIHGVAMPARACPSAR